MGRFEDQVVVVTGGAKGQGRNHALAFAREGAHVVVCDIARQIPVASPMGTVEQLDETVMMVDALGRKCIGIEADTRSSIDMRKVIELATGEFGRVDVFVANAGVAAFGPFIEMTDDMWYEIVSINLSGVATSIRSVIPTMVQQGHGRIIATASAVGREGGPNNANYAASKWGVIGFVKSVAIELAPLGITVNAVSPMSVSTDMCHNDKTYGLFRPDLESPTEDDVRDTFATLNPMKVPWLEMDDVTNAVLFLASDEARYVTGTAFDIAGGWNAFHGA